MKPIRNLRADEVELRVSKIDGKGFELLVYKNSRTDQNILDELHGWDGWKREHKEINGNIYCGISVWSDKRNEWITKWDCGSESFTDKDKGAASDSFKRAAVNFGIGRELYSAPKIRVWETKYTKKREKDNKNVIYEKFYVTEMEVKDGKIVAFAVADSNNNQVFCWYQGKKNTETATQTTKEAKEKTTSPTNKTTSNIKEKRVWLEENYNLHKIFIDAKLKEFKKSEIKWLKNAEVEKIKTEIDELLDKEPIKKVLELAKYPPRDTKLNEIVGSLGIPLTSMSEKQLAWVEKKLIEITIIPQTQQQLSAQTYA